MTLFSKRLDHPNGIGNQSNKPLETFNGVGFMTAVDPLLLESFRVFGVRLLPRLFERTKQM